MIYSQGTSYLIQTLHWAWHYTLHISTDRVWGGYRALGATAWAARRAHGRHCRCPAPTDRSDTWHSSPHQSQLGSEICPQCPGRSWLKKREQLIYMENFKRVQDDIPMICSVSVVRIHGRRLDGNLSFWILSVSCSVPPNIEGRKICSLDWSMSSSVGFFGPRRPPIPILSSRLLQIPA